MDQLPLTVYSPPRLPALSDSLPPATAFVRSGDFAKVFAGPVVSGLAALTAGGPECGGIFTSGINAAAGNDSLGMADGSPKLWSNSSACQWDHS